MVAASSTDWVGIAAVIAATGAAVGGIVSSVLAFLARKPLAEVHAAAELVTPAIGQIQATGENTNAQVTTLNGGGTLGEIAERLHDHLIDDETPREAEG